MKRRKLAHLTGVLTLALAAMGLVACSPAGGSPSPSGEAMMLEDLAFGVDRQPHSLDPYKSVLGGQFLAYLDPIYDTLIHQETDGTYSPGLATEWSYLSPTEFEMVLREDVMFSDGETPFDATAVQKNLDRLKVVTGGQTPELAPMYDSTEIVDDHRVIVNLTAPNPDLERILSQVLGMMANPTALDAGVDLALEPQGVGAYTLDLDRTVVGDTYVYEKVDGYWDAAAYPFEQLTVKVYTDRNAMLSALQSGVATIGYGQPDTVQTAEGYGLGVAKRPVVLYFLNLIGRDSPPLDDVRVRQALNYAVDREAILKTLYRGFGQATPQVFPEGEATGYDPELQDAYPYDPAKAKKLLAEAGYEDGFSFTTALPVAARDTPLAEALASYYAAVGVTLEITALPPGTMGTESYQPFDSSVTGLGGQGAFIDAQQLLMPTGLGLNAKNSQSDEFDRMWEEASDSGDTEERAAGYRELAAAVVEQAWFVPVARLDAIALYDTDVISDLELTPGLSVPRIRGWQLAG